MSTVRLTTMTMTAVNRTRFWTIGKSRHRMAWTRKRATPGRLNTVSVTTSPPMRKANSMPITVITGRIAFLSACRQITTRSVWPLARAVRT
jgi:hypothetical protein